MGEFEMLEVVNENDELTGERVRRDKVHENGIWHRSVHVWIYSSDGQILLQRRSKDKADSPGLLDISSAGHVSDGQTPMQAVSAELSEEIGVEVVPPELARVIKDERTTPNMAAPHRQMLYMYFVEIDASTQLTLNDGEVEDTQWIAFDTFKNILVNPGLRQDFVNHSDGYIEYVIEEIGKRIKHDKSSKETEGQKSE